MAAKKTKAKFGWGGARRGAGRPKDPNSGTPHTPRPKVTDRHRVLVTFKKYPGCPSFREHFELIKNQAHRAQEAALKGFTILHGRVERDQIVLLVRARSTMEMARGVQGLGVRISRNLNGVAKRTGDVFAERYAAEVLSATAYQEQLTRVVGRFGFTL